MPNPGHGHRHLPHLAAGLRLGGYATQPEDFSACSLNQEDPFEQPRGASHGHVLRPARYPLVATSRWLVSQDWTMHPRWMWMRVANPLPVRRLHLLHNLPPYEHISFRMGFCISWDPILGGMTVLAAEARILHLLQNMAPHRHVSSTMDVSTSRDPIIGGVTFLGAEAGRLHLLHNMTPHAHVSFIMCF